jgi:hypothetical protein
LWEDYSRRSGYGLKLVGKKFAVSIQLMHHDFSLTTDMSNQTFPSRHFQADMSNQTSPTKNQYA